MQIIPEGKGRKFAAIIDALELSTRCPKPKERIEDYATDIERLANVAYFGVSGNVLERLKIGAFVIGLRDAEPKKAEFTETLNFALIQEAGSSNSTSSTQNIRKDANEMSKERALN